MEPKKNNILIIKTGALGDVLRTTVILPCLRKKYPGSLIDWFTSDEARCILEKNPLIDRILIPSRKSRLRKRYNLVISLEEDEQLLNVLNDLQQDRTIGLYKDGEDGRIKYTKDSAVWFGMSLVRPVEEGGKPRADELKKENKKTHPMILSEMLGIDCTKTRPMLQIPEGMRGEAREYLIRNNIPGDRLIGLNPYAGQRWPGKEIPFEKTLEIVNHITGQFNILLLGGKENLERNRNIKSHVLQPERVFFIRKKTTITELAAFLTFCEMIITTDSLPLHVANSLGKKTICVISHTSAEEIELYGNGIKIVTKTDCFCSYKSTCDKNCMNTISIQEYTAAIGELEQRKVR